MKPTASMIPREFAKMLSRLPMPYAVEKTTDHYWLVADGRRICIICGNERGKVKHYAAKALRAKVRQELGVSL